MTYPWVKYYVVGKNHIPDVHFIFLIIVLMHINVM